MKKTSLKLMQIQLLNKGKIQIIPALSGKDYILDTNIYFEDIKLPKNVKMILKYKDTYRETISFALHDIISDEYLGLINCSLKRDLKKSNEKSLINEFIDMNYPNIIITQKNALSFVLDSNLDVKELKVPEGLSIKLELYGPNDEVQCHIIDENDKKIGVINCKSYKSERKMK